MPKIIDNIPLVDFGLDTDSANRLKEKGSSPYFLNVLKGEDSSYGELTNLKGNRKVTYQLGSSEVYFVAWSCYDPLTRNVYYYIFSLPYDTTGSGDYEYDNRFIRFNEDDETIVTLFYDNKNYFGVDPTIKVKDSFVLGDWLFYNPQTSEPKVIDLTMIYNYTTYSAYDATAVYTYGEKVTYFGGLFRADEPIAIGENPVNYADQWTRIGDSYQFGTDIEFDSEFRYAFNQIKHIPVYRPVTQYGSDLEKNANNVRGKLFRFSHRYKFFDNSYSRYSAYSDITLPLYAELYNGEITGDLDQYNCIDVTVPLHSPSLVKEIEIIFQETGGDWKTAKVVNRKDITLLDKSQYVYRFYNTDSAFTAIDDKNFLEPYDALPPKANCMEIINKNILTFGGVTEGFDNIDKNDIDVLLTPEIETIATPDQNGTTRRDNKENETTDITSVSSPSWITYLNIGNWYPSGVVANDVYRVSLNGLQYSYTLQAADVLSADALTTAIASFLDTNFPAIGITADLVNDRVVLPGIVFITESIFFLPTIVDVPLTKARGFKTGAWHPFCIYYYDEAMRRWDAQTSKDHPDGVVAWSAEGTTVYVPMLGEYSPNDGLLGHKWNINWEVNHLPPTEAKWWRWGYAGNALASKFVQYTIYDIGDVGLTSATEPINTTWIDITPLQTLKNSATVDWNKFPNSIIEPYSWQKGDRVRIITEKSSGANIGAVLDSVYDFEILAEDKDLNRIYIQDFDYTTMNVDEDSLIEIYTPIKSDSARLFYEFGELMPIILDSEGIPVHGSGKIGLQDQDTVTGDPATGVFKAGDVYHILRTPSKPIDTTEGYIHESQWYSDFYESDDWDKGRPGVETNFGERFLNIVRHSKQYLQNTLINGLSTFFGDTDYKELNDVFGDILRIIENGDTLKVYQRKKPSSILIGRTEYVDAEGNANIVKTSERVLGTIRYSTTNYGTEFPESITRNNRYIYGFDIYNGVFWRDSANGIFPISGRYTSADGSGNYKMETYFKQKAKALLVSGIGGVDVETVWDERHKNLYVIFKDLVTEDNDEAIMFHEPSNRWIGFTNMDQTPEDGWNQMLELDWAIKQGFDGGMGYVFDEDTRFATFNVVTTHNDIGFPVKQDLTMALFAPTIVIDCTVTADLLNLSGTLPPPTIFMPYIALSVPALTTWAATELYGQSFTVTSNPSTYRVSYIPSWLWLDYASVIGSHLSVGNTIPSGTVLYAYPKAINTGGALSDVISFENDYANTASITVGRAAALGVPTVRILSLGGDSNVDNALQTVAGSGTCVVGSTTVDISFTCDHKDLTDATAFTVFATVDIKDGEDGTSVAIYPSGSGEVSTNEQATGVLSITNLSVAVQSGYWVYVYLTAYRLSVTPPTNITISADLNELTASLPAPTVKITLVSPTTIAKSWLAAQFGVANKEDFTIDMGDAEWTRITSSPTWLTIVDQDGTDLRGGHNILDTDTVSMYPTAENLSGSALNSTIEFINDMDDTYSITVQHQAAAAVEPITLSISGDDTTDLAFKTGVYRFATLTDGTALIDLVATFDSPLYGEGGYYTIYWYATKGGIFAGRGNFPYWDELEITTQLVLNDTAEDTDTIVIYFAGNYI